MRPMEGPSRRLPADLAKPAPAVLPRQKVSNWTPTGKPGVRWCDLSPEQEAAARMAKDEVLIESVPADMLEAFEEFANEAKDAGVRAGRWDVVMKMKRIVRRVEQRRLTKPEGKA